MDSSPKIAKDRIIGHFDCMAWRDLGLVNLHMRGASAGEPAEIRIGI